MISRNQIRWETEPVPPDLHLAITDSSTAVSIKYPCIRMIAIALAGVIVTGLQIGAIFAADAGAPLPADSFQVSAYGLDASGALDSLWRNGIVVTVVGANKFPLQVPPALRGKSVTPRKLIEGIAGRSGLRITWVANGRAALLFANAVDDASVATLLKGLEAPEPTVRADAAWQSGWCADMRLLEPLLKASDDSDEEVAVAAAKSLDRLGFVPLAIQAGASARPFLLRTKRDDGNPQSLACMALALTGKDDDFLKSLSHQALAPTNSPRDYCRNLRAIGALAFGRTAIGLQTLIAASKDPRPILQTNALFMLGEFPAEQALPVLLSFADSKDPQVRSVVLAALGNLQSPEALPLIRSALADSNQNVRISAEIALSQFNQADILPELVQLLKADRDPIQDVLTRAIGRMATPDSCKNLESLINSEQDDLKPVAAAALGELPDAAGLSTLRPMFLSQDLILKRGGVNAMGGLDPQVAAPLLEPLLCDADEDLACRAITELGNLQQEKAVPLLIHQLDPARPRSVRLTASRMLAVIGSPDALVALRNESQSANATDRLLGIMSLEVLPPDKATSLLEAAVGDTDATVRAAAFEALGKVGGPHVFALLLSGLKDSEGTVRYQAVDAISQAGTVKAVAALGTALSDPNEDVRTIATAGLSAIGSDAANTLLQQALSDPAREVRLGAVKAFENQGTDQARKILLAHLKIEKDSVLYTWLWKDLKDLFPDDAALQKQLDQLPRDGPSVGVH